MAELLKTEISEADDPNNYIFDYFIFSNDEVPVSKRIDIDGTLYILEIQYNEIGNFFNVILRNLDEEILLTSKLTYANYTFHETVDNVDFKKRLIPMNVANIFSESRVLPENFGKTVFLFFT